MEILLKNIRIITDPNRTPQLGNIAIEGKIITDLGEKANLPAPDLKIDGEEMVATQAFTNSHTHSAMSLLRGYCDNLPLSEWLQQIWAIEKFFTKEDCYAGSLLASLEMIKSGIGAFVDFYFHQDSTIKASQESGLKVFPGSGVIEGAFLEQGGASWMLQEVERILKLSQKDDRVFPCVAPHAPHTVSEENLLKAAELADKYNAVLTIHVSETRQEVFTLEKEKGLPPVEWLEKIGFLEQADSRILAVHCVWITQREVEILGNKGAGVAYCPTSNMKLASGGVAPIPELIEAGAGVYLGTDGPSSNNTLDIIREMKVATNLLSSYRWDPSIFTAKDAFTTASATFYQQFLGGSENLEIGKPADIVLLDFRKPHLTPLNNVVSNIVYAANGGDVDTLIVDGRPLMVSRVVQTLDEAQVLHKAKEQVDDLLRRKREQ